MSVELYRRFAVVVDLSWIELKPLVSWCVLICDNRGSKRGPTICKKLDSAKRLFTILKPFCRFLRVRQTNALPGYLMVSLMENMSRLSQASTCPVQWHALMNFTTLGGNL